MEPGQVAGSRGEAARRVPTCEGQGGEGQAREEEQAREEGETESQAHEEGSSRARRCRARGAGVGGRPMTQRHTHEPWKVSDSWITDQNGYRIVVAPYS